MPNAFNKRKIGRADIEESKSGIALNAPPPQASYPCSITSCKYKRECITRFSPKVDFQCTINASLCESIFYIYIYIVYIIYIYKKCHATILLFF